MAVLRALSFLRAGIHAEHPADTLRLEAQERHLRRKLLTCQNGMQVLVDLEKPVVLENGDALLLEDGRLIQIVSSEEPLTEVRGRDARHLAQLAWHIGNRHLEAQIEADRILIRRDHVITHMLEHQGATVRPVTEKFSPEHGAYHAHGDQHEH